MDAWTRLAFETGSARLDITIAAVQHLNNDVIGLSGQSADRRADEALDRLLRLVAS